MAEETKPDEQALIAEFYSKPFNLSYSGLNKLLYSPSLFYRHYILQQREDKLESYLIDGKVIHCLLLDNGSFDTQFMLSPSTLPTGNTKLVVDRVFARHEKDSGKGLFSYKDEIIAILKEINLHQALKTDVQRVEKIINEQTHSYWEFLQIRGSKDIIDDETLARCNEAVAILRLNPQVCELLGLLTNEMQDVEIFNEIFLTAETDKSFGLKGFVDNIKLDRDKKIIFINDLKTTGKTISDFQETIEFYNYWAQAAIYYRLVCYLYNQLLEDPSWKVVFNFIVIDKYNQVYPFEVSQATMNAWLIKLESNLNEAEWHYTNRNYTLPYQFATGKVIL
jgi:hypothetical protein